MWFGFALIYSRNVIVNFEKALCIDCLWVFIPIYSNARQLPYVLLQSKEYLYHIRTAVYVFSFAVAAMVNLYTCQIELCSPGLPEYNAEIKLCKSHVWIKYLSHIFFQITQNLHYNFDSDSGIVFQHISFLTI